MSRRINLLAGAAALSFALVGCGGGGGGAAFIPQPPPEAAQSITIFPNPTVGEFVSVGVTSKGLETDLGRSVGPLSTADADQPHVRYTSAGTYEIQMAGGEWDELLGQQGTTGATDARHNVDLALSGSKDAGYQYSELAYYIAKGPDQFGAFAFGTLTPGGAVPTTGSATYSGVIRGTTDVTADASSAGDGLVRADASGTVTLNFDFATGSLDGHLDLSISDPDGGGVPIGTFAFKDSVFSAGSTTYSGKFDTAAAGDNFFLGKFTGPHAEETIGTWALPFILDSGSSTITADHKAHEAFGAWIAKH